jgi:hypothetical protein
MEFREVTNFYINMNSKKGEKNTNAILCGLVVNVEEDGGCENCDIICCEKSMAKNKVHLNRILINNTRLFT